MNTLNISPSDNLRHYLNPIHVYCRLIDLKINKNLSKYLIKYYELLYKLFD